MKRKRRRVVMIAACFLGLGCGARTALDIPVPCVAIEPDAPAVVVSLTTERELGPVDLVILSDVSQSSGFYLRGIQRALAGQLVPSVRALSDEACVGLATFSDFPEGVCGNPADHPFRLVAPACADPELLDERLASLYAYGGGDTASASNVEALYQLATGEGVTPWVRPQASCPDETDGYACFRRDALPLILHFADSPFHNGPRGLHRYEDASCPGVSSAAHQYEEAVSALRAIAARVVSFHPRGVSADAIADLAALGRDTRSLGADGRPLVFDLGPDARALAEVIPVAMSLAGAGLPIDVNAVLVDPDPFDAIDPRVLVEGIFAARAIPATGVRAIEREAGVFRDAVGSVQLEFELALRHAPGVRAGRYRLGIELRADMRAVIDRRVLDVVVTGADAACGGR